ncbi:DUF962-domain-containing protein [Metschnikowia bicuspidata var. bicuspidata NRRL YB-4993]|uniref:DUF962-domain-containing protein n=1 Tax=Metschnikowia bicuspidata var. bicuspidata NRRL YB-4993 TaxID=869754 RepID=A0A1A0HGM0_9ASCO|nr:DUF962-domain-containing protein [Metschnikowia bicuspidata var. bicuspidata NRRL YB-4993]OBA23140.1 DUF962-domain-containing protein [Metschnikowia bicuspidata var. bicuspidata NRRL YB-4993]
MPGIFDIKAHLVFYRKYHFNNTNVAIHLVCIPIILLSAISFSIGNVIFTQYPYITTGVVAAWLYGLYYVILDWQLGVPAFLFLAGFAHVQRVYYLELSPSSLILRSLYKQIAITAHIISWLAQFYGHAVYERRAPALFDNLLQAVVLAPFFVVYEIAFWLGFKLDIKKEMDNQAGKFVSEMSKKKI